MSGRASAFAAKLVVMMGRLACGLLCVCLFVACGNSDASEERVLDSAAESATESESTRPESSPAIVAAARDQIGRTVRYDPAYIRLEYPGGDVPIDGGVCTDVIIRALRDGVDVDLQRLVHEDMSASFDAYPTIWGLSRPDRNIDHRRVPNLRRYFERMGYDVTVSRSVGDYLPGDLVTCTVPPHLPHIMIVSDRKTSDGVPLVIHNIGRGAREEDILFAFPTTGHYRLPPNR